MVLPQGGVHLFQGGVLPPTGWLDKPLTDRQIRTGRVCIASVGTAAQSGLRTVLCNYYRQVGTKPRRTDVNMLFTIPNNCHISFFLSPGFLMRHNNLKNLFIHYFVRVSIKILTFVHNSRSLLFWRFVFCSTCGFFSYFRN